MWCATQMSYPEKHPCKTTPPPYTHFLKRVICFLAPELCSSCTLDISSLLGGQIAVIFFHSEACLVTLIVSFTLQKFFSLEPQRPSFLLWTLLFFGPERYCWVLHVVYVSCHFTGFITSSWVLVEPGGFSMCPQIMWPTNRYVLVFLSGYHTFSPTCLVAPAMASTRMLKSAGVDISDPDLWEKAYDSPC